MACHDLISLRDSCFLFLPFLFCLLPVWFRCSAYDKAYSRASNIANLRSAVSTSKKIFCNIAYACARFNVECECSRQTEPKECVEIKLMLVHGIVKIWSLLVGQNNIGDNQAADIYDMQKFCSLIIYTHCDKYLDISHTFCVIWI